MAPLFSKETRVLVVEPNSSARKLIGDCIKQAGLENVQSMDSVKNALGFLEVEEADWLIAPLSRDQDITLFHLLDVIRKHDNLRNIRASVFVDKSELPFVPFAFELGAVSWHARNFTKDAVKAEVENLKKRLASCENDLMQLSIEYFHEAVTGAGKLHLLAPFYSKLCSEHEDVDAYKVKLAEAYFDTKRVEEGKACVARMRLIGMKGWEDVAKKYLAADDMPPAIPKLKRVLYVDPDEMTQRQASEVLKRNGVGTVVLASDGASAMESLSTGEFDFVFQEWKIPGLGGAAFVQRVRHQRNARLPIVVVSSLLGSKDTNLLSEMGVARILPKPFTDDEFQAAYVETLQHDAKPQTAETLERKIREACSEGEVERAEGYLRRYLVIKSVPEGKKFYARAAVLFQKGMLAEATVFCKEALKKGGEPLHCTYLLGKILARRGEYAAAVRCFEKAQDYSPKNIERLCELSEAQVRADNAVAAGEALDTAKAVDAGSERVISQEARQSLANDDVKKARDLIMHLGSLKGFVSDLNNTAVAHIRSGHFEKGIVLYSRCLEALPPSEDAMRSRVSYNHALALARRRDYNGSHDLLDKLSPDVTLPIAGKIETLLRRVKKVLKEGGTLGIEIDEISPEAYATSAADAPDPAAPTSGEKSVEALLKEEGQGAPTSDTCARYVVTTSEGGVSLPDLLRNGPKYKPRSALSRAEGMGVERMMN